MLIKPKLQKTSSEQYKNVDKRPMRSRHWPFILVVSVVLGLCACSEHNKTWFNVLDKNNDNVVSFIEWEIHYPRFFWRSGDLYNFRESDCDESQYLTWKEYKEGRLQNRDCPTKDNHLLLYGKEGVRKLPYPISILTETQYDIYNVVEEGESPFWEYEEFAAMLPDIRNNTSSNAAISMECDGTSIRTIKYSYLELEPGGHPSLECTIKSDTHDYYTWLGMEVSIDNLEAPVIFIKPLYVDKPEMKLYIFSEFGLEGSDVKRL